ncbi:MAG: choice-of-anchor V domain-containing protein [Bacteroidota bacterium]|nr:choice-of-anchor V domain-containing protein [Bacteroidota bacterium]
MQKSYQFLFISILFVSISANVFAYPTGISGYTNKTNSAGCGSCHSTHSGASTAVQVVIAGPTQLKPGQTGNYTVTISGGTGSKVAVDIAGSAGTLNIVDNNLKVLNGELTHPSARSFSGGKYIYNFAYTAPLTEGAVTLYATGMSSRTSWNFASNFSVNINAPLPINAPSGLNAQFLSGQGKKISLQWTDNSSNETTFKIERKEGASGVYSLLTSLGANSVSYIDSIGLTDSVTYYYRVFAVNEDTISNFSNEASVSVPLSVNSTKYQLPAGFTLYQNYPNPFNPSTNIKFYLAEKSFVQLTVSDMLGRLVEKIADREMQAGEYSINFDARSLSSGIYYYSLNTGKITQTRKMLLIK